MNEINNEELYVWIAPDGEIQFASLAPDPIIVEAFSKLLHKKGIGLSPHQMKLKGFTIEKVKVNIEAINEIEAQA